MAKKYIAAGLILLMIGLMFLGLSMSPNSLVMAVDDSLRKTQGAAQLVNGRLDITVVVVTPSWTNDLVNTNTGVTIVGTTVTIGTYITFKGTLKGTDGNPIPNYWVTVNLLASGKTAESGDQCWLGSAKTDANGAFGSGYSIQVRSDGWYSTYPGVDGAYVQTKNGAGNPGCQSWATTNPSGKSYSGYAAVSSTYYSSAASFSVGSAASCPVTGNVYINDVAVSSGQTIRTPPNIVWAFVATSSGDQVSKVTLTWSGTASGSVDMPVVTSGSKWQVSNTLAQGTYTAHMTCTCVNAATATVLSLDAQVGEWTWWTVIVGAIQAIRDSLVYTSLPFLVVGVVAVGYGVRKHRS